MSDDPEQLFQLLKGRVAEVDPIPDAVVDAGRRAIELRTIDAELAALVYDSRDDELALVGVRSSGGARQLTFEAGDRLVEVELASSGRTASLVGQLVPPAAGRVDVRHSTGELAAKADELGRFSVSPVPSGSVSLRVAVDGARTLVTDWIAI